MKNEAPTKVIDLAAVRLAATRAKFQKAGWSLNTEPESQVPANVWLYSCNMDSGIRVSGQLTVEAYRLICAGGLTPGKGVLPGDYLTACINRYDAKGTAPRTQEDEQELLVGLAVYAQATQTWTALREVKNASGIHVVICDWLTSDNVRVLRPAGAVSGEILPPEVVLDAASNALSMHLARFPKEAPVSAGK